MLLLYLDLRWSTFNLKRYEIHPVGIWKLHFYWVLRMSGTATRLIEVKKAT